MNKQNGEYWEQLSTLYDQVMAMDEETRTRFLDEHCRDEAMRMEIESLLKVQTQSDAYFDSLSEELLSVAYEELSDLPPQSGRVGRYRIIEKIGRGGMGSVYLAERDDGAYNSRVAVKILRRGMDSDDILARFRVERQILARLNHPNITHLLDGGLTSDGRPYFVMEHVQGESITGYCDEKRLTIRGRIRLFLQICDALQYAHQNLVIHRDLKPGNILVTGDGQVKLLDFGIAKLLDDEPGEYITIAGGGHRLLTPEFASPEQVKNIPINTASDVYQLGVVLYNLLAGRPPFSFDGCSIQQAEKKILEEEPAKPSRNIFGMQEDELAGISQKRSVSPQRLRSELKGDLDAIVMKALQKEPSQRFGSVQDLRDDLLCFLNGQPVIARPATVGYRIKKFVRRHRAGTAVAVVFLIMLGGFIVALLHQQAIAIQERDRALTEAGRAEAVKDFLIEVFETADPEVNRGEQITANEMLNRGVEMAARLASQPELHIDMLTVAGEIYRSLGDYDSAFDVTEEALSHAQALYGPEHEIVAGIRNSMGKVLMNMGDFATAKQYILEALDQRRRLLGSQNADVANSLNDLSAVMYSLGEYEQARTINEEALGILRSALGDEHPDVAGSLNNLGVVLNRLGEYEQARTVHEEALNIRLSALGDEHPDVANSLNNLGALMIELRELEQAQQLFEETVRIRLSVLGEGHPDVAQPMNNLGAVMIELGEYEQARTLYEEVIHIRRSALGDEHPATVNSLSNLGVVLIELGELEQARRLYEEVVEIRRSVLGEGHTSVAVSLSNLGILLNRMGEYEQASVLHWEVLEIFRSVLGDEHPSVAVSFSNLGTALREAGNLAEARSFLEKAVELERKLLRDEQPSFAISLTNLAMTLQLEGDYETAEEMLLQALDIQQAVLPEGHWRIGVTKNLLGVSLAARGEYAEAEVLLTEGYRMLVSERDPEDIYVRRAKAHLDEFYRGGK